MGLDSQHENKFQWVYEDCKYGGDQIYVGKLREEGIPCIFNFFFGMSHDAQRCANAQSWHKETSEILGHEELCFQQVIHCMKSMLLKLIAISKQKLGFWRWLLMVECLQEHINSHILYICTGSCKKDE